MPEDQTTPEREAVRLEHELRLYRTRMDFWKVVAGTMVVGIAAAGFPFAQKYAEVTFQAQIEEIKAAAEERADQRAKELERMRIDGEQLRETRTFLQTLAQEGRSSDIETRIRLAEFFSFVSETDESRAVWSEFRDYLVGVLHERRIERERLLRVQLDENADPIDRHLAAEGIASIARVVAPRSEPPQERQDVPEPLLLPGYRNLSPAERSEVMARLGPPGGYGEHTPPLISVALPEPLPLAWDRDKKLSTITIHESIACHTTFAFRKIYDLGLWQLLDSFGGSYNPRQVRGGSTWSNHSWAIAINLAPDGNQLSWGRERALFAREEYQPIHEAFEEAGFANLGRLHDRSWGSFVITPDALLGRTGPETCRSTEVAVTEP